MCWRVAKRKQHIRSVSSKSKSCSSNSVFSRSASSFQKFSQSCDTHASIHFMPSSIQENSSGIHFLLHLHAISSKTWSISKMKGNINQSSSVSVTAKTVLSFILVFLRETDLFRRKCLNECFFLTFPFKKLWGKLNYFCCAFITALHILHISCDIILNISSITIIIMLDIVAMRHYIHKQPYSTICNTKYIMGKSSTAMLLLIYIAWKTKNSHPQNYAKWPSIHSVVLFSNFRYESTVIPLNKVVRNYLNFCFFGLC